MKQSYTKNKHNSEEYWGYLQETLIFNFIFITSLRKSITSLVFNSIIVPFMLKAVLKQF